MNTRNRKTGLIIAGVLGVLDVIAPFIFPTDAGDVGPPAFITALGVALGVITLICVAIAWRSGSRGAIIGIVVTRVISALSAVPAFIFGAPVSTLVPVAIFIVLTVVCVYLLLKGRSHDRV